MSYVVPNPDQTLLQPERMRLKAAIAGPVCAGLIQMWDHPDPEIDKLARYTAVLTENILRRLEARDGAIP